MTEFPTWYCPVFSCPYRTSYSHNIEKHLSEVHDWNSSEIAEVVKNFFEAHRSGVRVICAKSSKDPTYPKKKAWILWAKLKAGLLEGREGSLEPDRSVSSVGGGGGE